MSLPPLVPLGAVSERLAHVRRPAGAEEPPTRMAARTLFALLYAGAVEGTDRWLRPAQVVRMSDAQAARAGDADRLAWAGASGERGFVPEGRRWYAENTRESVREVLRGLCALGAVIERSGLPDTSPQPRWALTRAFVRYLAGHGGDMWAAPDAPAALDGREESRLASLLERVAREAGAYAAAHPDAECSGGLRRVAEGAREAAQRLARCARQQPPASQG